MEKFSFIVNLLAIIISISWLLISALIFNICFQTCIKIMPSSEFKKFDYLKCFSIILIHIFLQTFIIFIFYFPVISYNSMFIYLLVLEAFCLIFNIQEPLWKKKKGKIIKRKKKESEIWYYLLEWNLQIILYYSWLLKLFTIYWWLALIFIILLYIIIFIYYYILNIIYLNNSTLNKLYLKWIIIYLIFILTFLLSIILLNYILDLSLDIAGLTIKFIIFFIIFLKII